MRNISESLALPSAIKPRPVYNPYINADRYNQFTARILALTDNRPRERERRGGGKEATCFSLSYNITNFLRSTKRNMAESIFSLCNRRVSENEKIILLGTMVFRSFQQEQKKRGREGER